MTASLPELAATLAKPEIRSFVAWVPLNLMADADVGEGVPQVTEVLEEPTTP